MFEHWLSTGDRGSTSPPDLPYADPVPMPGKAGDVIFMHYLTVHSASSNREQSHPRGSEHHGPAGPGEALSAQVRAATAGLDAAG